MSRLKKSLENKGSKEKGLFKSLPEGFTKKLFPRDSETIFNSHPCF